MRLLLEAIDESDAVGVRATVQQHLGRPPTRAEMNAVRRAAYQLVDEGTAKAAHGRVGTEGLYAADYLVLVREGVQPDKVVLRMAASGRTSLPGPLEEQQQMSAGRTDRAVGLAEEAADLARQVDADLLDSTAAAEAAIKLRLALEHVALLQRRLLHRGGL